MFRLLLTAPFLAGSLAVGCASPGAGPEGGAPWVGAPAASDPELEALLRPEEPIERAGLYHGQDGRTFYVADLSVEPPRGFLKTYESLLCDRGVLVQPTYPSPHDLPPRVEGYRFLVFAKGDTPLFSLKYRQFYDGGGDFQSRSRFASVPSPFNLQGRTLALSLGEQPSREWIEAVLVPEEDVVRVKELPFGRYPGAMLRTTFGPDHRDAEDLLEDDWITRVYVATGASIGEALSWYANALKRLGLTPDVSRPDEVSWRARDRPVQGMTRITVRDDQGVGFEGLGLSVDDLRKRAPALLELFPPDVVGVRIHVTFARNAIAAEYWLDEDQALRREALEKKQ